MSICLVQLVQMDSDTNLIVNEREGGKENVQDVVMSENDVKSNVGDNTLSPMDHINQLTLSNQSKDETIKQLQKEVEDLKDKLNSTITSFENKFKQQQWEATRKENILVMRLTLKEQELQECLVSLVTKPLHHLFTSFQM